MQLHAEVAPETMYQSAHKHADFVNEAIQAFACGFNEVQLHAEVDAAVQKHREQNPGALQVCACALCMHTQLCVVRLTVGHCDDIGNAYRSNKK